MFTLKQIRDYLNNLTDEQLAQPPVFHLSETNGDKPQTLHSIIAVGTTKELFDDIPTRSPEDNEYHPEYIVFLADYNPYDEDGNFFSDLSTEICDKCGKEIIVETTNKTKEKTFVHVCKAEYKGN